MKFYDVDNALQEAINAADKPVRLKIEIEMGGYFQPVFEQDIIEANFYSIKEAAGGVSSRGDVLIIKNEKIKMNNERNNLAGSEVRVFFSIGDGLPYFQRFKFFIDNKGIQEIKGPGRKRHIYIGLQDLSYKLRKTDEARDWTAPAIFTYSVVCDKTMPEKSLVHGIAKRAGLNVNDIDCSTIPVTLPFIRLHKNIWAELSSLAAAYRCHLECAPEKPLVFAHSPYQNNEQGTVSNEQFPDNTYTIKGDEIFYLRKRQRADYYKNTVRLKVNMPVALDKQEIWRYDEPPVFYDEFYQAFYPFKYPLEREIEISRYEAKYRVVDDSGKERNVVFADDIDTKEEAENRLFTNEKCLSFSYYDTTSYSDRAVLTLKKEVDCDLYNASIHGRPIVLDLNRSCFMRDDDGINNYGTVALNITGSYFSDFEVNGKPHYEDWVGRELAERIQQKHEYTVKTHKALFNSRVGAKVKISLRNEEISGTVSALSFRYKRHSAFISTFRVFEDKGAAQ